jgi:hypothetical protein
MKNLSCPVATSCLTRASVGSGTEPLKPPIGSTVGEQDHGLVVYFPPDAVRVATGKGRYHESTFAGAGMAYVRGQVLTADGRLLASLAQDAMIRALAGPAASVPSASRR